MTPHRWRWHMAVLYRWSPRKIIVKSKRLQLASLFLFLSPSLAYFSFHILLLFDFLGVHTDTFRPNGMKVYFCFHSSRLPPPRARSSSSSERRVLRFFRVHWPHNAHTHTRACNTAQAADCEREKKWREEVGTASRERGCDENIQRKNHMCREKSSSCMLSSSSGAKSHKNVRHHWWCSRVPEPKKKAEEKKRAEVKKKSDFSFVLAQHSVVSRSEHSMYCRTDGSIEWVCAMKIQTPSARCPFPPIDDSTRSLDCSLDCVLSSLSRFREIEPRRWGCWFHLIRLLLVRLILGSLLFELDSILNGSDLAATLLLWVYRKEKNLWRFQHSLQLSM